MTGQLSKLTIFVLSLLAYASQALCDDCIWEPHKIIGDMEEFTITDTVLLYLGVHFSDSIENPPISPEERRIRISPNRIIMALSHSHNVNWYFVEALSDFRNNEFEEYQDQLFKLESTQRKRFDKIIGPLSKRYERREIEKSVMTMAIDSLAIQSEMEKLPLIEKFGDAIHGYIYLPDLKGKLSESDMRRLSVRADKLRKDCLKWAAIYREEDSIRQVERRRWQAEDSAETAYQRSIDSTKMSMMKLLRDKQDSAVVDKYGESLGKKLLARELWVGISNAMIQDAWGKPDNSTREIISVDTLEDWMYLKFLSKDRLRVIIGNQEETTDKEWTGKNIHLFFVNGVLKSWHDPE